MRRAVRLGVLAIGLAAWSAYQVRVALRSAHMLQLEGYETHRFLRWAARNPLAWLRFQQAKKPFVLTARAKRLLAGQATLLGFGLLAARSRRAVWVGGLAAVLAAPLLTAASNVLLWPVEESFRRYYLRDARHKL